LDPAANAVRYVGVPGMINLPSTLAEGLDVRMNTRVKRLHFEDPGWALWDADDLDLGRFDVVLVALPSAQAAEFLAHAPKVHALLQDVEMAPCWAGMYVFESPLALGFDGAFLTGETLSWVARNSSKPGRPRVESWIVHANPEWSHANLGMDQDQAATTLLRELQAIFGSVSDPVFQRGHRWAYASGSYPTPRGAIFDADLGVGACGDWCMGGRIEGALLSGAAAADHILAAQATFQTPRE
jgi:predicted NAD/FAD-dependent oxidoreductase